MKILLRRLSVVLALSCLALLTLLPPRAAHAQEAGESLRVYVMTFGPGDHPFFKFGHNAIWIHDDASDQDRVYNFGTFAFDSPWLIADFFKGKLRYWLSISPLRATIHAYRADNRSVEVQELNLTPAQRAELFVNLEQNAEPANRYYKYDYYLDNCSTRVRDAVDRVIGGRLRAAAEKPGSMTWRQHTLRLTANLLPEYFVLDVTMGDVIDQPITLWQEMFLPSKLQEGLRQVTVPTPRGDEPLVRAEKTLYASTRPPMRPEPPHWVVPCALFGGLFGLALAALGLAARRSRVARHVLGGLLALIGGLFGFLGCGFVLLWALTDHVVAFHNENILQLAPWLIAFVYLGPALARGRERASVTAARLMLTTLAASLLGLVLKVLPAFDQDNGQIIAFALPLWIGATAALLCAVPRAFPAFMQRAALRLGLKPA